MNEAQKYLQEIISKRRKVITFPNDDGIDANVVCYFRKTITSTCNTPAGDICTSILAELETMEGRLIYINARNIKFID